MKTRLLFVLLLFVSIAVVSVGAANNGGSENISIHGGSRGDVPFPHHAHQNRLKDCNTCHTDFPQEAGSIETQKKAGKLKPKQVMNKQCVKCHRDQKKAGNPTGPTTCSKCHVK